MDLKLGNINHGELEIKNNDLMFNAIDGSFNGQ